MSIGTFIRYEYGPASLPEIVWTALSAYAAFTTFNLLRECFRDRDALVRSPLFVEGGDKHIVAEQNIRLQNCILAVQTLFLIAGIVACLTATPPHSAPTPYSVTLACVFIMANGILTYCSYRNKRDRKILLRMLRMRRAESMGATPTLVIAVERIEEMGAALDGVIRASQSVPNQTTTEALKEARDIATDAMAPGPEGGEP